MLRRDERMSSLEFLALQTEELCEPTKEELERTLTKEDLIKLCMHKKCRVQLNRWNSLHQFYLQLERKGRTKTKSPRKIQKLLKKFGNKYKNDPTRSFSLEQIETGRAEYWKYRKGWNVRWLDMNKENEVTLGRRSSSDSCVTIITQAPSTDKEEQPKTRSKPPTYMNNMLLNATQMENSEVVIDSESLERTDNDTENINTAESDSLHHLEDAVSEIVSTQSVCTETQQPELLFEQESDYETFHVSIPATSTQSQEKE